MRRLAASDELEWAGSKVSVRRLDSLCIVQVDGAPSVTVQDRLEQIGSGTYQHLLLAGVGGALLSECLEMGAVAPLHTALAREYSLTGHERAALPLVTFGGAGIGLFLAGPISERYGRKSALILSLSVFVVVMFATALLPASAPTGFVLLLRFASGLAGAIQVPAGSALLVESCPPSTRARLVFQASLLGSMGYVLEALLVHHLLPRFGEHPADAWRAFCMVVGASAVAVLPIVCLLSESPSFYAVNGDAATCVSVLDSIARTNGLPPMQTDVSVEQVPPAGQGQKLSGWLGNVCACLSPHWQLLALLAGVDSCRSFFTSGSSYLWKDLFILARGSSLEPATLNVFANCAPILGIIISERLLWMGVRKVAFLSAAIAVVALAALTQPGVHFAAIPLVTCAMSIKLAIGPMSTCIGLIKAEAFPTEIRVTAYSAISIVAKMTALFAPVLIENLKGGVAASNWSSSALQFYIILLLVAAVLSGVLSLRVPGTTGDGGCLEDFATDCRALKASTSGRYGSFSNSSEIVQDPKEFVSKRKNIADIGGMR